MKDVVFDVMCNGRFVMQFHYRWCPAFQLDLDDVKRQLFEKRPSLKGKDIKLYETVNVVR